MDTRQILALAGAAILIPIVIVLVLLPLPRIVGAMLRAQDATITAGQVMRQPSLLPGYLRRRYLAAIPVGLLLCVTWWGDILVLVAGITLVFIGFRVRSTPEARLLLAECIVWLLLGASALFPVITVLSWILLAGSIMASAFALFLYRKVANSAA